MYRVVLLWKQRFNALGKLENELVWAALRANGRPSENTSHAAMKSTFDDDRILKNSYTTNDLGAIESNLGPVCL
jgi:hypothetical protein